MNDLIQPPAERDLPPDRAARMRARLLTEARGPRPRQRRRLLVAAAAVLVVMAGSVAFGLSRDNDTQILAMGAGELDSSLRRAVQGCLKAMEPRDDGLPPLAFVPVSAADVTIASRRGQWIVVLFLTRTGYMACDMSVRFGLVRSSSVGGEAWPQRDWLPGPVQRLSLSSTEQDGGSVSALGRVSARVDRLVLEHGDGHTTTARIEAGAFGLIADDVAANAELVSYDRTGREIDRRSLFGYSGDYPHCYTDPSGRIVYGERGPACLPADPWTPPAR
ncbi:hypothetical protein Aab01nite_01790 [Paractinoplanes abujensis]|uniref:Uncharacterized protein n=1 Tax=Paractinoplanes abujensis TaxID=882441 RepID=A0A7W7CNU3_9ACTN|nr:hypothetical protein [Actinoplanes abujensis]MBB4691993.1 hypothetical protein [Actinoplanes abujensis]GID16589.1 hypothetical protein Aab01nite_01790 [Actinoplanes abujensis]